MITKKKSPQNTNDKKDDAVDYTTLFFGDEKPEPEKVRGLGVLLEDINSKMSQVIEKVDSSEERLGAKIDSVDKKLSEQLDVVKSVLKQHSEKFEHIEAAVTHHTKILNEHTKEFIGIKKDVSYIRNKVSEHDSKLSSIESSIGHLGQKVCEKFDDHEERIVVLEKTVELPRGRL